MTFDFKEEGEFSEGGRINSLVELYYEPHPSALIANDIRLLGIKNNVKSIFFHLYTKL